ncbi:MAG: DUF1287 domain-containing protein [Kiritimatiellaeota bacterium]|nr:DUF1287 domain-containing protein [Kiritimatiellota bacterium]
MAARGTTNQATVVKATLAQVGVTTQYDPAYARISYPGGDVPRERGVCADVIVRAFRAADVDLQVLVHDDMQKNFAAYPQQWKLKKPDSNIDHRRVLNLETFFTRAGKAVAITDKPADYLPGDVVSWRLANKLPHIGLVVAEKARDGRPLVVHNIGAGARLEDVLFDFKITGHFRYFGP